MAENEIVEVLKLCIKLHSKIVKTLSGLDFIRCGKNSLKDVIDDYFKVSFNGTGGSFKEKDGKRIFCAKIFKNKSLKDVIKNYDNWIGSYGQEDEKALKNFISNLVYNIANFKETLIEPMSLVAKIRHYMFCQFREKYELEMVKLESYMTTERNIENMNKITSGFLTCNEEMLEILRIWNKYEPKLIKSLGEILKKYQLDNDTEHNYKVFKKDCAKCVDRETECKVFTGNDKGFLDLSGAKDMESALGQINNRFKEPSLQVEDKFIKKFYGEIKSEHCTPERFVDAVEHAVSMSSGDNIKDVYSQNWIRLRSGYDAYLTGWLLSESDIRKEVREDASYEGSQSTDPSKLKLLKIKIGANIKPAGYKYKSTFVGEGSILNAIKKEDLNIMEYINFVKTLASFSKSPTWKSLKSAVEGDTNGSNPPPLPPRKSKSADLMADTLKSVKLRKVDESEKNKYSKEISKSAGLTEGTLKSVNLRKVDESEKNKYSKGKRPTENGDMWEALNKAITARRQVIEDSDNESDDEWSD